MSSHMAWTFLLSNWCVLDDDMMMAPSVCKKPRAQHHLNIYLTHDRTARKVLEAGQTVSKASVAGSLLAAVRLNLWGLGATLLGLQARHPNCQGLC